MAPTKKTTVKKTVDKKAPVKAAAKKSPVKKTVAKEPVAKKAPAKKAPVKAAVTKTVATKTPAQKSAIKKSPVKKAAVKKVAKVQSVVKEEPKVSTPVENTCACAVPCCGCSNFGAFVKKLIVFFVIFALGFATCRYMCSHGYRMGMHKMRPGMNHVEMFTDGCLDMNKIKDPEFAEHVMKVTANADTDNNGCVSIEEFKNAARDGMRKMDGKGPMPRN